MVVEPEVSLKILGDIQRLHVKPKDLVIVTVDMANYGDHFERVSEMIATQMTRILRKSGHQNQVVVLPKTLEMSVAGS